MTRFARKPLLLEAVVAVLCVLILGSVSLVYPFGSDQGSFAYMSSQLLEGKKLYLDVFNIKPPLTYYLIAMVLSSFGHTMMSIRIFDLLWQIIIVVLIILITSHIYPRRTIGLLSALFYAISYYGRDFWNTAQTDGFLILPLALGVLAFLIARERQSIWLFFVCGFAIGIATMLKYTIGIMLPLLGGLVLFYPAPKIWHRFLPGLLIALGALIALGFCLSLLWLRQELDGFFFMNFGYLPVYVVRSSTPFELLFLTGKAIAEFMIRNSLLLGFSSIAFLLELVLATRSKQLLHVAPLLVWWIGGIIHLAAQMKFFSYHSLPVLVPQSILLARGFFVLYDWAKPWKGVRIGLTTLLVLFMLGLSVIYEYPRRYQTLWQVVSGQQTLREAYEKVDDNPKYDFVVSIRANLQVAEYLKAHTKPSDSVFIWSFEPMIYFLAERDCASRYVYNHPLFVDIPALTLRQEFLLEMKNNQPVYILIARNDEQVASSGQKYDSQEAFERFDAFREFVNENYTQETVIEDFTLYRRNE